MLQAICERTIQSTRNDLGVHNGLRGHVSYRKRSELYAAHLDEWMIQRLLCSDTFRAIESKAPLHEIDSLKEVTRFIIPSRMIYFAPDKRIVPVRCTPCQFMRVENIFWHVLDEDVRVDLLDESMQRVVHWRFDLADVGLESAVCGLKSAMTVRRNCNDSL